MGGMGLSRLDAPGLTAALTVAMWASKEGGAWAGEAEGGPGAAQVAATRLRVTSAYSGGGGG